MAFYRRGTAALGADGIVTGTDTKWKDQLALIRVGATMIFLDNPIKLAVVSDIVSDTQLKVISTDGETAPNGKYVILLNDSLTVNALAQNVAETLRYYQSSETEIAQAMDTLANLDMDNLNQIVAQIKQDRADAQAAAGQAGTFKDNAAASATASEASKNQAQQIVDGAVNTVNSARDKAVTTVNSTKDSAVTTINQEEASAISAINSAKGDLSGYVNDAKTSAQTATAAKNDAQAARNDAVGAKDAAAVSAKEAKDAANSVDAGNILHKDQNLADVPNKVKARENIEVPKFSRQSLGNVDLNTIKGADNVGFHIQAANANATTANHYPENTAGALLVLHSAANGPNQATQLYFPYNKDSIFYMRQNVITGGQDAWSNWKMFMDGASMDRKLELFGLNQTGYIQENDANNIQRNGFFAGAGVPGVNYARPYAPGIVMRRVNDVYQAQLDDKGRWIARFYTPSSGWGAWASSLIAGDYGVGGTGSIKPANTFNQFMSDNDGNTQWAPSNGAGFQTCYDSTRLAQFWINPSSRVYYRWNQTGNAQAPKSSLAWKELQQAGTSDERVKDIKGRMNVEVALENINRMEFKLFKYTFDDNSRSARRGVIAQQIMKIDREYVHFNDNTPGMMTLDLNPLVTDSMAAIKALKARDEANKERIGKLEGEVEELKSMIKMLMSK